ncbi:hypothetical protein MBLNU457_g0076t1 [Dothideomycetes sp. NU457]
MFVWLTGNETTPPVALAFRSSRLFLVASVSAAVFTDIFLYGIVVPVLPFALTTRIGISPDDVQTWVSILLAVYGAALLAASPVCGWLADRTESRRMPLLGGLFALAGSTVLLTVGNSIGVLVAGRVLQGLSAGVVWVVGLALLVDTVGSAEIGEAMGYVGMAMSLAVLVAPLLGGVVFDKAGYDAVFAMGYGLLGFDIVMRVFMVEKKIARRWVKEEDSQEAEVVPEQEPDETSAVSHKDTDRVTSLPHETGSSSEELKQQADPPLEPANPNAPGAKSWTKHLPPIFLLLSSRRLLAALWGCLIQASLLTSFDSTLPIFVRDTFGWDSTGAGLIFLPIVVPSFLDPIIGWTSDKYANGARWLATIGFVAACPILILLRLVSYDSIRQKVLLCALLALLGLTLSMVLVPLMAEITYAVEATAAKRPEGFLGDKGAYAQAYGLFNMAFAGGCLVGPLVGGLINQHYGWGATTLALGCMSIFSAVPTFWWTGSSWRKARGNKKTVTANQVEPARADI